MSHRRAAWIAFLVAPICMCSWLAAGQQSQAQSVFRSGTDLVEVQVVVTDKKGGPVRNLTPADFQLLVDGKPQEISTFSFVDLPLPAPTSANASGTVRAAGSDVASNVLPSGRRIYVLALDGFNVDPARSLTTRKLANQFIEEALAPGDMAAVLLFGNTRENQPFTSDKARLKAAVEKFIGQKSRSATLNTSDRAMQLGGGGQSAGIPAEDPEAGLKANQARIMFATLQQICESLGRGPGDRRAVILFSEGPDIDTRDLIGEDVRPGAGGQQLMHQPSKYADAVLDAERDMLDAARRANVSLYTVEPRGNSAGNESIMQDQLAIDPMTGRVRPPATLDLLGEAQRGQGTLRTLSSETGGIAVVGTDRFAAGFTRIVQANSAYYVLGFRPPAAEPPGRYRRIAVDVKSRDDVEVVARRGYVTGAPSNDPAALSGSALALPANVSARARALLESDLARRNGIDLRASGGPIEPDGDNTLVGLVLEIDGGTLPFSEHDGQLSNDLELAFIALDGQGAVQAGSRSVGHLVVPAAARDTLAKGLRYVVEFGVHPGRYQIRVAVAESVEGRSGSALLDVDVPAFNKVPIALGIPLLTTRDAGAIATSGSYPKIQAAMPAPPVTRREFSRDETLLVMAALSGNEVSAGTTLTAALLDDQLHPAVKAGLTLTSADIPPQTAGVHRLVSLPLQNVPPGTYSLTVDAASPAGHTAHRVISIQVR